MLRTQTNRSHAGIALLLLLTLYVSASSTSDAQTKPSGDGAKPVAVNAAAVEAAATDKFRKALIKYRPILRFDSGEDFFPLKADAITNNVGNRLARDNNQTIAERQPGGKELRIGYLRGGTSYPNGKEIRNDDRIIERHENKGDYFDDAARLQSDSRYRDRIYRRLVLTKDNDGRVTGAWLQYFFFYYYNDFPIGPRGGDHEGDWELAQIKLDPQAIPVYAVYMHHGKASKCVWRKVNTVGSRPIVYVARGSHASYFRAGAHGNDAYNDGDKHRNISHFRPISNSATPWINWPGFWGGTRGGGVPVIDTASPKGPKMQEKMWDPELLAGEAEADDDCKD